MHKTLLTFAASLTAVASLAAQTPQPCGFNFNVVAGATSRGAMANRAGELMFRFDSSDYVALGRPAAPAPGFPGSTQNLIDGVQFILQDQYAVSQEGYNLHIYTESATAPDYPTITAGQPAGTSAISTVTGLLSPTSTTASPAAWQVSYTFTTPVAVPNNADAFVSVELQASAAANTAATPSFWPNDGLSVQISLGIQPGAGFTVFDLKGAAPVGQTSYGLVHDVTNALFAYGGARQGMMDLLTTEPGRGVATAITNQATYTISNTAPGTASFFSALHPDAATPPFNGGRVDDLGYVYQNASLPAGSLVFYLVDLGFAPGNLYLPLSSFMPGSTGVLCLSPNLQNIGLTVSSGPQTNFTFLIPSAARGLLGASGLSQIAVTAIGYDVTTGALAGAPCAAQKF